MWVFVDQLAIELAELVGGEVIEEEGKESCCRGALGWVLEGKVDDEVVFSLDMKHKVPTGREWDFFNWCMIIISDDEAASWGVEQVGESELLNDEPAASPQIHLIEWDGLTEEWNNLFMMYLPACLIIISNLLLRVHSLLLLVCPPRNVLRHQVIAIRLCFRELHLVHPSTCVVINESFTTKLPREQLAHFA